MSETGPLRDCSGRVLVNKRPCWLRPDRIARRESFRNPPRPRHRPKNQKKRLGRLLLGTVAPVPVGRVFCVAGENLDVVLRTPHVPLAVGVAKATVSVELVFLLNMVLKKVCQAKPYSSLGVLELCQDYQYKVGRGTWCRYGK